jgi:hypothetical protein
VAVVYVRSTTVSAVSYDAPSGCGVAAAAHRIGVPSLAALRELEQLGDATLAQARVTLAEAGRLDLVLPLLTLIVSPRLVGRGVQAVVADLLRRWPRRGPELRRADVDARALEACRSGVLHGAYAYGAGDTLRRVMIVQLGPLMTTAQVPDVVEQILTLGVEDSAE